MSDVVKIRPALKSRRHFTGRTPASAHRPVAHRKYNWKSFLQPHSFGFSQRPAAADTEMYSRRKCRQPAAGYGRGDPQTVPGPAPTEISLQEERRSSKYKSMTDTLNKMTEKQWGAELGTFLRRQLCGPSRVHGHGRRTGEAVRTGPPTGGDSLC